MFPCRLPPPDWKFQRLWAQRSGLGLVRFRSSNLCFPCLVPNVIQDGSISTNPRKLLVLIDFQKLAKTGMYYTPVCLKNNVISQQWTWNQLFGKQLPLVQFHHLCTFAPVMSSRNAFLLWCSHLPNCSSLSKPAKSLPSLLFLPELTPLFHWA